MVDPVFGELQAAPLCNGGFILWGALTLDLGGQPCSVEVRIDTTEHGMEITPMQYESYQRFLERWPRIQPKLIQALIRYYNEVERFAWGPDDPEEFAAWWPEIETEEALLRAVTLETLVVPWDWVMTEWKGCRCVYLLFARAWGGVDWDENGIGVRLCDEEIDEVSNKDIAY